MKFMIKPKLFHITLITFYAFIINWISGTKGVLPIDSFAFFDTGFSILEGKYPIRDFWIHTGLLVDYIQSLFFFIFSAKRRYIKTETNIIVDCIGINTYTNDKIYKVLIPIQRIFLCFDAIFTK